jgi:hypothetical protein
VTRCVTFTDRAGSLGEERVCVGCRALLLGRGLWMAAMGALLTHWAQLNGASEVKMANCAATLKNPVKASWQTKDSLACL